MWTLANALTDYVDQMRQYIWKHFKVKYCIQVAHHPLIPTQTIVALLWSRRRESTRSNSLGGGDVEVIVLVCFWHQKYM